MQSISQVESTSEEPYLLLNDISKQGPAVLSLVIPYSEIYSKKPLNYYTNPKLPYDKLLEVCKQLV